jgi:glycosyltransferase involved in cell wall biosynthesis
VRIGLDATPLLGRRTGIGRYTTELLRGLAAAGDDELVATAFTLRGGADLPDLVPPGVSVRARRTPARLLRAVWSRAEFPPVAWSAGQLDVFHATNFVLPPTGRAAGVVTVHDLSFLRTRDAVDRASLAYRELVPRSIARAAVVVTPSRAVADELEAEYGLDPWRVRVTHLGVDASWASAVPPDPAWRRAHRLPEHYLVAVGTLEPRKNLQALVDAFGDLLAEDPAAPDLVLVGLAGWGTGLRVDGGTAGRVHFTGYLEDAELKRVVAGSRGLAFPSLYEGFGLPPLEALACGLPVVVSDLPVMREVLGPHAAYVPVDDRAALAAALASLGDRPPGAEAAAREHAMEYTWDRCARETREVYRQAALALRP